MFGALQYTSDNDKIQGSNNLDAYFDKSRIMITYADFFSNLCKSLFLFSDLKETMENDYLNSLLIDFGSFAFVDTEEYGLVASPYKALNNFDLNGYPTRIELTVPPNVDQILNGRIYNSDRFVIVKLNPMGIPLRNIILYFSDKIAENQRAIDQNVYSCQTPTIYEIEEGQEKAITELQNKLAKMVKNIVFKRDKRADVGSMVKVFPTPEFKGDKFISNIQYYEGQLYTFCGFKHSPFEKKERMIVSEVASNDEILNVVKSMMLRSIRDGLEKTNKKFGVDFKVEYTLTNRTSNFDIIPQRETESTDKLTTEVTKEGDVINGNEE